MAATLIDGRAAAQELKAHLVGEIDALRRHGTRPGLATIQVGDDPAASAYERRVRRLAEELDCLYHREHLPADAEQADLLASIGRCNADPRISGILVLRPLGKTHDEAEVFRSLDPAKDIEALHPKNAGLLALGTPRFVPSTPASCFHLLDRHLQRSGTEPGTFYRRSLLVVVGRSNNVGKPAVLLGMQRNATVVSCDEHTSQAGRLAELTRQADILVVAAGVPGLIGPEHLKPGAIVIDVGINPVADPVTGQTRLVGDVRSDDVRDVASALTPVPGGVGPVTDVWLLRNTLHAAQLAARRTHVQAA
ncbi:bifunctional 5,10-methylenetetrahydrofolate dehydrogenase/5,10-methenyltetrahydrofolate cyclohydrolase [Aciditerrimonas ferrireducens]|uniref:bifunctional 5,10-methylenetetrahydrofolate dehydrogenase/5,10-methenyltetrahydrofolate cyclohydrolase n=1 Tax=Aciditerrimonas ferrireducens TaxID=667306 RepID=UPI00200593A0|nr:tetrahydrofolate dehydrogenase/cyclohydrolase catalytic domain-containing protein [Aciditerrimonas ferrireducens]MCK4176230.1 bifunctional methylenetetrahydrofolate dehydrogenase/methenyltetrahydrofolate cyclohydrolase [Aciditerrimonas ferrireducens]